MSLGEDLDRMTDLTRRWRLAREIERSIKEALDQSMREVARHEMLGEVKIAKLTGLNRATIRKALNDPDVEGTPLSYDTLKEAIDEKLAQISSSDYMTENLRE